jgi:LmbE family N-acetylglucosaminyl deacetylase
MDQAPKKIKAKGLGLVVLAGAAHPDDIEFGMAGTLLLLKQAGAKIHMWNLANGVCGTASHTPSQIIRLRWQEARDSAKVAGAILHPPLTNDMDLFYESGLLAKVAAKIRKIRPHILLVPSPQDYMEDHQNACRLLVSAAFARDMRNFKTSPPVTPWGGELAIYHAMPHQLRDSLRQRVKPGQYVNVTSVLKTKREMLACHRSQKEWLDESQGLDAYLSAMEEMSRSLGRWSGRFKFAEGWRRHNPLGFSKADWDPLSEILGPLCWTDQEYEKNL